MNLCLLGDLGTLLGTHEEKILDFFCFKTRKEAKRYLMGNFSTFPQNVLIDY